MLEQKIIELQKENEVLKAHNELFSNSLTLYIVGEEKFIKLLKDNGTIEQNKIYDVKEFYKKFIKDFRDNLKNSYHFDYKDIKDNNF